MDQGPYNNNGCTPPYFNGWERSIVGWGSPITISAPSSDTIYCVADSNMSYKINLNNNEFFIIENRQQKDFDTYLPGKGLVIFHGDQDKIDATFSYNEINEDSTDRGFYIDAAAIGLSSINSNLVPFGNNQTYFTNTSTPATVLKSGVKVNKPITHIRYINDSVMVFNFFSSLPQVKTNTPTYSTITGTKATVNGSILYNGSGATITERGFYWTTNADSLEAFAATKVLATSADSAFSASLNGLPTSTMIFYKAFATTVAGTDYGAMISFTTTDGLGTIITSSATQITDSTALLSGSLISTGDDQMNEKGFVYSTTNQSPTIADSKISITNTDLGAYSCSVKGLSEQTTYYYRAFVTTSLGTKYGAKKSFTTTYPLITGNTISSAQTFCTQGTPQALTSPALAGGHGNFAYLWEQKVRDGAWTVATQAHTAATYQPETLTDSTYYRRIVTSNATLKDTSNTILINIQSSWGGELISIKDTINKGESTGNIRLQSHKGSILNWERQRNNEGWTIINRTSTTFSEKIDTSGLYSYRVKVQQGTCPEVYSTLVTVYLIGDNSLNDVVLAEDLKVYPVPADKVLTITSSYEGEVTLRLVNTAGQEVMREQTQIQSKQINISALHRGSYILTLSANGKINTRTIIVK